MTPAHLSRRDLLSLLASASALPLLSACSRGDTSSTTQNGDALSLLNSVADNFLALYPETATSLGVDIGTKAALRAQLQDRSTQGQNHIEQQLRADLDRLTAFDASTLPHELKTTFAGVRSCYATSLEGFALPYGDVATGSWRNTPYVVIQNVGAYLDIPRFLDTDHRIENAADAETYIARLQVSTPHPPDTRVTLRAA